MASQGQRFRRRALRRGYKVDEVDAFLDRVEATLDGEPVGAPVASQEVHDVVFRVRFNGYDEWQVDLHLDRVERQLAELEERGGAPAGRGRPTRRMRRPAWARRTGWVRRPDGPPTVGPPAADAAPDRCAAEAGPPAGPIRGARTSPTGPFAGGSDGAREPAPDRMGPPDRMARPVVPSWSCPDAGRTRARPLGPRALPAQAGPPGERFGRYDEPSGAFPVGGYDGPRGGHDGPRGPAARAAPARAAAGGRVRRARRPARPAAARRPRRVGCPPGREASARTTGSTRSRPGGTAEPT